jgi:hypothetical protein
MEIDLKQNNKKTFQWRSKEDFVFLLDADTKYIKGTN